MQAIDYTVNAAMEEAERAATARRLREPVADTEPKPGGPNRAARRPPAPRPKGSEGLLMPRAARKVAHLDRVRLAPVPEVVEALQDLLKRAKSGELRGFAMGTAADQNCDGSSFCIGDGNIAVLVLSLERVKLRLLDHRGDD